jgi:hypothetical protein
LGNIIGPGADKKNSSQADCQYWCTGILPAIETYGCYFFCQYWFTGVLPAIKTDGCFFAFWNTMAEPTDDLLSPPSQAQWQRAYRTFTWTPGETLNTPTLELCPALVFLVFLHMFFWPCMVLHKTTQHDMFLKFCKRLKQCFF